MIGWHMVIDSAVREWRQRLRACIRVRGGHFDMEIVWCECDTYDSEYFERQ